MPFSQYFSCIIYFYC